MEISPKDIIVPIATAILGVALPLLLGVIQRIDEKYESTRLMKQFINQKYNLYASILKLNENPDLMEKFREIGTHTEKQLKQSVLISAEMNVKVAWRLNIKMVLIKISDSHKGNDDLSNITQFENDEK